MQRGSCICKCMDGGHGALCINCNKQKLNENTSHEHLLKGQKNAFDNL